MLLLNYDWGDSSTATQVCLRKASAHYIESTALMRWNVLVPPHRLGH